MKFNNFLILYLLSHCFFISASLNNNFLGQANSNQELYTPNPFEFLNSVSSEQLSLTNNGKNQNNYLNFNNKNENNNNNDISFSVKCQICGDVYDNKFDFQIMIEQQNKCQFYQNKFGVSKDNCVAISKNIAYKFFDNGGDSYFDRDLAQKIKTCRNMEINTNDKKNILNCQKAKGKVCDILYGNNDQECENLDLFLVNTNDRKNEQNLHNEKEDIGLSASFMEMNKIFSENKEESTNEKIFQNSQKESILKNIYSSVDKQLEEISELEKTVKDLEKKTKEAKQTLFNKIVEAQASSKAIQDHLSQIITRVKTEIKI